MSNSIATMDWKSRGVEEVMQVFFVNEDGKLYFCMWDGPTGDWGKGDDGKPIASNVHRSSPLAATTNDAGFQVYYVDTNKRIIPLVWNPIESRSWVAGPPLPATDVADNTSLVAVIGGRGGFNYTLFYQQSSGTVQELVCDDQGVWSTGASLTGARRGTKLALANSARAYSKDYFYHLFGMAEDTPRMIHWSNSSEDKGGWREEKLIPYARPDGGLACVAWPIGSKGSEYNMRLYFPNSAGDVMEYAYSSTDGWNSEGPTRPSGVMSTMDKPLAAVSYSDEKGQNFKVLTKDGAPRLLMMCGAEGKWDAPVVIDWNRLKA
ncbi:hypothetical protein FB451DRAFT_184334 [Mycena latifolia]|nr:hypothetical protein FB451DRAFT_184334 [Mycena latifolia]